METYLHSAERIPSGLFALACEQLANTWQASEYRVPPGPADIRRASKLIADSQRAVQRAGDFSRRQDQAKAGRLTPEWARELLESRNGVPLPDDPTAARIERRIRDGWARVAGIS
jgi:hypothetical protein